MSIRKTSLFEDKLLRIFLFLLLAVQLVFIVTYGIYDFGIYIDMEKMHLSDEIEFRTAHLKAFYDDMNLESDTKYDIGNHIRAAFDDSEFTLTDMYLREFIYVDLKDKKVLYDNLYIYEDDSINHELIRSNNLIIDRIRAIHKGSEVLDVDGERYVVSYRYISDYDVGIISKVEYSEIIYGFYSKFLVFFIYFGLFLILEFILIIKTLLPIVYKTEIGKRRLDMLFDLSTEGLFIWNIDCKSFLLANSMKKYIVSDDEYISEDKFLSLIHPDDIDSFNLETRKAIINKSENFKVKYRIKLNNSYKWMLTNGLVTKRNSNQNATEIIGIHSDITDVISNDNKYELIFSMIKVPCVLIKEEKVIGVNRAFLNMLKSRYEEDFLNLKVDVFVNKISANEKDYIKLLGLLKSKIDFTHTWNILNTENEEYKTVVKSSVFDYLNEELTILNIERVK